MNPREMWINMLVHQDSTVKNIMYKISHTDMTNPIAPCPGKVDFNFGQVDFQWSLALSKCLIKKWPVTLYRKMALGKSLLGKYNCNGHLPWTSIMFKNVSYMSCVYYYTYSIYVRFLP